MSSFRAFLYFKKLVTQTVKFPNSPITVRHVIATIKAQTNLRYMFVHCGNGSTILLGGDCSMGLYFSLVICTIFGIAFGGVLGVFFERTIASDYEKSRTQVDILE